MTHAGGGYKPSLNKGTRASWTAEGSPGLSPFGGGHNWESATALAHMDSIGCAPGASVNPVKRRGKAVRRLRRALEEWTNDCDSECPAAQHCSFQEGVAPAGSMQDSVGESESRKE